eukprot:2667492-Pyramimonas_sp.AAC.1
MTCFTQCPCGSWGALASPGSPGLAAQRPRILRAAASRARILTVEGAVLARYMSPPNQRAKSGPEWHSSRSP